MMIFLTAKLLLAIVIFSMMAGALITILLEG